VALSVWFRFGLAQRQPYWPHQALAGAVLVAGKRPKLDTLLSSAIPNALSHNHN